jgi:HEAT repeat protein
MSQVSQLSPELTRGLLQLARALLAAARNWTLYPPEHPTVASSVARLRAAIHDASGGAALAIGVTPDALMIEGAMADSNQTGIAEAAALLHDRDLVTLSFIGEVPAAAIHTLLRMLTLETSERRALGGPAAIWEKEGDPSVAIEQIDYKSLLAREEGNVPEPARRDDLWRSIVMSISAGQSILFDEMAQRRLLAIAGSPADIGDLAAAAAAPKRSADGSPMITSQAAIVLAAFRHLKSIVSVMSPDRMPEVVGNLAAAATQLDPHVIMQVLQSQDDNHAVPVVGAVSAAFDDVKVAQLLATALALDGCASDRLATIFNTIAPDEERKRRVLTLTRSMLSETDFGKSNQFQQLWSSTEELLVSYNDTAFVSDAYRASLDGVGARAETMAAMELPPELPDWIESLGQESVRQLSAQMLIDLFALETSASRAGEIANDMEALAEDLLMSGAYDGALRVVKEMARRAATKGAAIGQDASRQALDRLGDSLALRETVALIGDVDDEGWKAMRGVIAAIGVASVDALKPVVAVEQDTVATGRAEEQIVGFGAKAVSRLSTLVSDSRWFVQRRAARLLGRIGAAEGVPLLQPLLRQGDARVAQGAIAALSAIPDPAAARAIQTVLRAASGDMRRAVTAALVAGRDPRVVPMLGQILKESEPLGRDHDVVLETIDALGSVGTDAAVPFLVDISNRRKFFGGSRLRALKARSIDALVKVGTPRAAAAVKDAAHNGDRALRKIAAPRVRS